jgi:hypothetical protein
MTKTPKPLSLSIGYQADGENPVSLITRNLYGLVSVTGAKKENLSCENKEYYLYNLNNCMSRE